MKRSVRHSANTVPSAQTFVKHRHTEDVLKVRRTLLAVFAYTAQFGVRLWTLSSLTGTTSKEELDV